MTDSIVFLGKFDEEMLLLENKIIKLQEIVSQNLIDSTQNPDVKQYPINGCNCDAWAIIGNVKPTLLLKNLISEAKIVIFVFNLTDENSLTFLLDGWGPIVEKVDRNKTKNQERILIGTISTNKKIICDYAKISTAIKKFVCTIYCEDKPTSTQGTLPTNKQPKFDIPNFTISQIIDHLKGELMKDQKDAQNSKTTMNHVNQSSNSQTNENYEENSNKNDENTEIITDDFSVVYKISNNDKTAEIIESPKATGEIIIPTSITYKEHEFTVTNICDNAFKDTSIKILAFSGDSKIERIGNFSFNNSKLEILFIPDSLTELSEYWIGGADNLSQVIVNRNLRYFNYEGIIFSRIQLQKDSKQETFKIHFIQRSSIGFFTVDQNFSSIGSFVFYKWKNLKFFTFENPNSKVIEIGDCCFYECKNLSSVTLDSEEVSIGEKCFKNCSSLDLITFSNMKSAKFLSNAFTGCSALTFINISSSSLHIGNYCFYGLPKLAYLILTTEELYIGDSCFKNCISLSSIYFNNAKNVTIGKNAFEGCKSLSSFDLIATSNIILDSYCFNEITNLKTINIYCGEKLIIGDFCFNKCTSLNSIIFQKDKPKDNRINSMTVGNNCFEGCSSISSFECTNIENIKINKQSFKGCNIIEYIFLTKSQNIEIDEECFNDMNNLNNLVFQSDKLSLNTQCINNCRSLKNIIIETKEDLTVSSNTFKGCPNIMNITFISGSTLTILENSFNKFINLETINLTGNSIVIQDNCFNKCICVSKYDAYNKKYQPKGELILKSNSLIEIGNNCFNMLLYINSIQISGKQFVSKVKCFNNCYSLSSLTISDSTEILIGKFNFNQLQCINSISFINTNYIEIGNESFIEYNNFAKISINPILKPQHYIDFDVPINENDILESLIGRKNGEQDDFNIKIILQNKTIQITPQSFFKMMSSLMRVNNLTIIPYTGFGFMNYKQNFCPIIFRNFVTYDTLKELFENQVELPGTKLYIILLGITYGMKYLHSLKISHSHLALENVFIDEQCHPLISDFGLYNQNDISSFKNDVYSYSTIAYILITGRTPLINNSYENISLNLKYISDPIINELFERLWLFDFSFIPPFDDIFNEIKSDTYKKYFDSDNQEVSKYLKSIEKTESNEISKYDQEFDETIEDEDEKIVYKLNNANFTAEVIESPKASGYIFIPQYFEYKSKEYKITRIVQKAFSKTSIETLSFSLNSFVESIGDYAFEGSKLQNILIPKSLRKLDEFWSYGAENLSEVKVYPGNSNFFEKKDIVYYSNHSKLIRNEIIFISPNFSGKLLINPNVTHIGCFSLFNCSKIRGIESKSRSLEINSYSFCFCENLEYISLIQTDFLSIQEKAFYGMAKLNGLEIKSKNLLLKGNFIRKCPSLKVISIEKQGDFTILPNTFIGCESVLSIKFKTNSIIKLTEDSFSTLENINVIEISGKQILPENESIINDPNLRLISIITPKTFCNLNNLTTIILVSESLIKIVSNSFENCPNLNKISIISPTKIEMFKNCIVNSKNVQSITIKSKEVIIDSYCFDGCINLNTILIKNAENATIGPRAFNKCNNLSEFKINASSSLTICDYCFDGADLDYVELNCVYLTLGQYAFFKNMKIQSIKIHCSNDSYIDDFSFYNMNRTCNVSFE